MNTDKPPQQPLTAESTLKFFDKASNHIADVNQSDYSELIEVWERATLASTETFLPEEQHQRLKPLMLKTYFD